MTDPGLTVVMYHYVRDLPQSRFPDIKGLQTEKFLDQIEHLDQRYQWATMETALAFVRGEFQPDRDLCLLTFDDGLREHFETVFPILEHRGVPGVFFVISSCLENGHVVPVHKNHFLMASLGFDSYRKAFLERLNQLHPDIDSAVSPSRALAAYRFDTAEVAAFKFLLNFELDIPIKNQILDELFAEHLGCEQSFARELYMTWDEARQMQAAGMTMGGHSHSHQALAKLELPDLQADLTTNAQLTFDRLSPQANWPFSYPYGTPESFNETTMEIVEELGYTCAFSTEAGRNHPGQNQYGIRRIDTNDVTVEN